MGERALCADAWPLAASAFFPTTDCGLGDLSRSSQRRNACVRQFVAVLAHAVFKTSSFESLLMAKFPIIVCTFVGRLSRTDTPTIKAAAINSALCGS